MCTTEQTILDDGTLREKERIQLMLYIAPFVNIVRRDWKINLTNIFQWYIDV